MGGKKDRRLWELCFSTSSGPEGSPLNNEPVVMTTKRLSHQRVMQRLFLFLFFFFEREEMVQEV